MNITNAQFTATGSITALVDGVQMSIPADGGNRHYAAMLEQGVTPAEYVEPAPTADQVRAERDRLLKASDWIVAVSYERGEPVPQDWADYRQTLRDVPNQSGFPADVTWPEKPE